MKNTFIALTFICASFTLSGCTAIGIGAGATAGVAATQEGGLSRAYDDTKIQVKINELWFKHDVEMFRKLDMTINQGRVLLTGVVQDPEHRVEAVRLAWQPTGVKQVINEIRVSESDGIFGFAKDAWISGRLRTAITFAKDVQSINYNIDTVQGTIYLMGVANSQNELSRVMEIARTISGVKQVVSYVKFAGKSPPAAPPPSSSGDTYEEPQELDSNQPASEEIIRWE